VALHPSQLPTFYAAAAAGKGQPAGLYRTTSNGFEWQLLLEGEITALAVAVDEVKKRRTKAREDEAEKAEEQPFNIYAATTDCRFYRAEGGEGWQATASLPSEQVATTILPLSRSSLYVGTADGSVLFSEDGGESWRERGQLEGRINDLTLIGDDLYASSTQGVYVMLNDGWQQLNNFARNAAPLAAFQPTTEPGVLLVGAEAEDHSSTIYRWTTEQQAFTHATFATDSGNGRELLTAIQAHPTVRGACYAVTLTQAYASSDKGATWEQIVAPMLPQAHCLAVAKI